MPRPSANGIYRTEHSETSPAARPAMAVSPAPNGKAKARAEVSESGSGYDGSTPLADQQMDIIAQVVAEESAGAEKKLRAAVTALREEFEVNAAVLRDELLAKIDAKNLGAALIDETSEVAKRAVAELRRDLDKRVESTSTGIDDLRMRLDRIEREAKKRELESWRGIVSQTARNFARIKDVETKLTVLAGRLDALGMELGQLRFDLGDEAAKPWPVLALPAPS